MGTGEILSFKPEGAREVRQAGKKHFWKCMNGLQGRLNNEQQCWLEFPMTFRPLTRLKLGLSFLGDIEDVRALKQDVADMERMIEKLFDFVREKEKNQP